MSTKVRLLYNADLSHFCEIMQHEGFLKGVALLTPIRMHRYMCRHLRSNTHAHTYAHIVETSVFWLE